jgi:16S rRNA (adenine1518-N6/adenine1519-N6)-dimethyltransferase
VLVQKEVAERIARSKKASILSLSVRAYGKPQYIETVKARFFKPVPKVDSAILAIALSQPQFTTTKHEQVFFELLHRAFGQKRKQLFGTLTKHFDSPVIAALFEELHISRTARAETLPLATWITLSRELSQSS